MHSGDRAIRLKSASSNISWIMNVTPTFGEWTEITLHSDGTNFYEGSMNDLADENGKLGKIAVVGRLDSGKEKCFYIDDITIKYKAGASDDMTPSVISYNGPTTVSAYAGEEFSLDGISAYDNEDKASAKISYEWSDNALDNDGKLIECGK